MCANKPARNTAAIILALSCIILCSCGFESASVARNNNGDVLRLIPQEQPNYCAVAVIAAHMEYWGDYNPNTQSQMFWLADINDDDKVTFMETHDYFAHWSDKYYWAVEYNWDNYQKWIASCMMPNPGTPPIISVGDVDYHFVSVVATISTGDPTYPDAYIIADPSARGVYGGEFGIPGSYWRVEKDAFHDWISPFVSGDSVLHLGMADQSSKWIWPALPLQEPSWEDADIHSGSNALSRTTPIGRGDQIDEDLPVDDGGLGCPDCPPVSDTSYYFYNLAMQYISQMDTMLLSFIHLYCPGEAGWHFGPLRTVLFPDSGGSGKIAVGPEPSPTAQPGYIVVPIVTGAGYEIGSVLIFDGPGNTYGGCAFYPYLELLAKRSDPGTEKKALKQYGFESWARWTINPAQMISDEPARNIASSSSFPDDYSIEYFFEWGPEPNVPFFHYAKISSLGGSPRIFDIFKVEYVRGKDGFLHKKVGYDERTIGSSPVPMQFQLSQNYPNPFNASTLIEYTIPHDGFVKLEVYNVLGQTVSVLVDEFQSAGSHAVAFDTAELPSGVYFYRLTTGLYSESRKMVLTK